MEGSEEDRATRRARKWSIDLESGEEPDYRFTLANERTFLAWVRTSLALLAGAVAIREFVESFAFRGARRGIAACAAGLSAVLLVLAYRRWVRAQRAMRMREPLPPSVGIPIVASVLTVSAIVIGVLVILG